MFFINLFSDETILWGVVASIWRMSPEDEFSQERKGESMIHYLKTRITCRWSSVPTAKTLITTRTKRSVVLTRHRSHARCPDVAIMTKMILDFVGILDDVVFVKSSQDVDIVLIHWTIFIVTSGKHEKVFRSISFVTRIAFRGSVDVDDVDISSDASLSTVID